MRATSTDETNAKNKIDQLTHHFIEQADTGVAPEPVTLYLPNNSDADTQKSINDFIFCGACTQLNVGPYLIILLME